MTVDRERDERVIEHAVEGDGKCSGSFDEFSRHFTEAHDCLLLDIEDRWSFEQKIHPDDPHDRTTIDVG